MTVMTLELLPPGAPIPVGAEGLLSEVSALEARCASLMIVTSDDHDAACELERQLDKWLKKAKTVTQKAVDDGLAAHRSALEVQRFFCNPAEAGKRLLRPKIGAWRDEQRRLEAEGARELRLAQLKIEEEQRLQRAIALEAKGQARAAEAVLSAPPPAPIAIPQQKIATGGVAPSKRWSAAVTNFSALIAWVAEDITGRQQYLLENGPNLNRAAVSMKDALNIPGVEARWKYA